MSELSPTFPAARSSDSPRLGSPTWLAWAVPIGLLLAVLVAYSPAIRGDFIWDDDYYVVNNTALRSFDGIQDIWLGIFPSPRDYVAPQYYPMTHTSLWIDYRLWGLNPLGYHLTNLLLHAGSAWVLWVILRRLAIPGATLAAFVFALHPLHVESVAWITERKNVLSGFFYLLSLLVYLRFCGIDPAAPARPRAAPEAGEEGEGDVEYRLELPAEPWKVYALSLLLFVCAILSKSVTATLPAAVLLILWWKRRRLAWSDVVPLLPFFALGLAMSLLTSWMERNVVGAIGAEWNHTFAERLLIAGQAAWFYAGKLLWPADLAFMYERWPVDAARVLPWLWPLSAAALIAGLIAARPRIGDGWLVGVLFYGGTLLPALGFFNYFPMRYAYVADHHVYLASLGLIVPACATLAIGLRSQRVLAAGGAVALCAALAAGTFLQSRVYAGPERLWRDTIAKSPGAWMAHNNLGALLLARGDLDGAERAFEAALAARKDYGEAMFNLGMVAEGRGNFVEAERLYRMAIDMNEQYVRRDQQVTGRVITRRPHALPLKRLAKLRFDAGDLQTARFALEAALLSHADDPETLSSLGEIYRRQGVAARDPAQQQALLDKALDVQARAVDLDPISKAVRLNLANLLLTTGRLEEASEQIRILGEQGPLDARALNTVGMIVGAAGQWDKAARVFEDALQKDPNLSEARVNLEAARRRAATMPATRPAPVPATAPSGG